MPPVRIRLHNIRVPFGAKECRIRAAAAEKVGLAPEALGDMQIVRRSLDARAAPRIFQIYSVEFSGDASLIEYPASGSAGVAAPTARQEPPSGREPLAGSPVIVGSGPAGLFAALGLAERGYAPLVVERGRPVDERSLDVAALLAEGRVNPESNLLFGEGGAGAFSDGKLTTRTSDPYVMDVLKTLVSCGADPSILVDARPHIGSDRLPGVVAQLRRRIEAAGGRFRWGTKVERLVIDEEGCAAGVSVGACERLSAGAVVLAAGSWADDLVMALHEQGVKMEAKPFQAGVRIEHPQHVIDRAVYRWARGVLPAAEYITSVRPRGSRGVATFCMCPGGMIVPAVTCKGRLAINGASPSGRNGEFANAALIVTIAPGECAPGALGGLEFQRSLERGAFAAAGCLRAPAQRASDFLAGARSNTLPETSYRPGVVSFRLETLIGRAISEALKAALPLFEKKLPGFIGHGLLVAVESRASSAVRILRDRETNESVSTPRLYPAGEGAGYAGGIVSSAVDGIRTAGCIIRRFAEPRV